MTITFLGTNGWYDTPTGVTPCILIESENAYIILDAGNGIYKLEQYIKNPEKPIYLFLTHLHLDHIFGLHMLGKFKFAQGMHIVVPKGTLTELRSILQQPFTISPDLCPMDISFFEAEEGENTIPTSFSAYALFHSSPDFGYRFTLDGKVIAYTGDTGVCENTKLLAHDADILIHECSYEPGHARSQWGHTNPAEAALAAKEAQARRLLLTHFAADIYPTLSMRKDAETVAQTIFPNTQAMVDDEQIVL